MDGIVLNALFVNNVGLLVIVTSLNFQKEKSNMSWKSNLPFVFTCSYVSCPNAVTCRSKKCI